MQDHLDDVRSHGRHDRVPGSRPARLRRKEANVEKIERDGVFLAYREAGRGAPPILLVHGWTHDHTYLAPQFEHFRQRHRTVAVDQRGHGQSDKPDQDYTIVGFADDVAWLCRELGLHRPVVVGHSLGGVVALELAARFPELPGAVVMLDSPLFVPPSLLDAVAPVITGLKGPDYREVQRRLVASVSFLPTDDPERKARIVEHMSSAPQRVMASAFEDLFAYDGAAAAAACRAPVLYVAAAHPMADLARFRELCPQLVTGQAVGAGHYFQLEVPEQVNAMIDRFVATSLPAPVDSPAVAGRGPV
jgi:pimeloyl-ACP methyl ester carboxylesterase